jgi:hypothetical protein
MAIAPKVRLNGLDYVLREGSRPVQGLLSQQSEAIRFQGTQRRVDNSKVNRLVLYDWALRSR